MHTRILEKTEAEVRATSKLLITAEEGSSYIQTPHHSGRDRGLSESSLLLRSRCGDPSTRRSPVPGTRTPLGGLRNRSSSDYRV